MAYSNINPVFHGLGYTYGGGSSPAVALNRNGLVLEVHKNEYGTTLYYKVGRLVGATINWENTRSYDTGATPQVALNDKNVAVAVHKNELTMSPFSRTNGASPRRRKRRRRGLPRRSLSGRQRNREGIGQTLRSILAATGVQSVNGPDDQFALDVTDPLIRAGDGVHLA